MRKKIQKKSKPRAKRKPLSKSLDIKKKTETQFMRFVGLENLSPPPGAHKKKKLLGRGPGSGHGKTSTRGFKGQTSRAGRDFYLGFEGGQTPLIRKIPKRGFSNLRYKKIYQIVNLENLAKLKEPLLDPQILEERGLIKDKNKLIKILGEGDLNRPFSVKAHAFSKKAKELIEKAGGKVEILDVAGPG